MDELDPEAMGIASNAFREAYNKALDGSAPSLACHYGTEAAIRAYLAATKGARFTKCSEVRET